jgi:FtsH-binding integral membrane protein
LSLFESLSQTALVRWTAESDWGYPIVLTSHAIGMALVVGILLMLDLRVLGLANKMSFDSLRIYFRVAWLGLIVNACSGTLLFLANYTAFLHNTAFLTKMSLLVIGGFGTWMLVREVSSSPSDQPSRRARVIASLCIAIWLGAIVAGRIVGYTSVPE